MKRFASLFNSQLMTFAKKPEIRKIHGTTMNETRVTIGRCVEELKGKISFTSSESQIFGYTNGK